MQVEDEINDLCGVHTLLNIAIKSDLIYANLVTHAFDFVFETELCRPILDSEVDRDHDGALRQGRECLDTRLRLHVNAIVVKE